ncbi:hypothetical protein OOT46_30305 [Aquabacterium sp. A7-Y]|uniref:hypothetical protein n=1 Tax=Aquabacterium sp. A7-Y TaxID=1349605 RepID=UPI00223CC35C|nr:hypothetical protein [Aquabacterium sp. A7-Y]MCW7542091.1 hypothetical protein [Aquabacterium sp. A7-Y]
MSSSTRSNPARQIATLWTHIAARADQPDARATVAQELAHIAQRPLASAEAFLATKPGLRFAEDVLHRLRHGFSLDDALQMTLGRWLRRGVAIPAFVEHGIAPQIPYLIGVMRLVDMKVDLGD